MFFTWFVSLFVLLVCLVFFFQSSEIKRMGASDPAGPTIYPLVVMAITSIAALAVLARSASSLDYRALRQRLSATISASSAYPYRDELRVVLRTSIVMALSLLYPYVILKLGFVIATAIFMLVLMQMFDQRLRISVPFSLVLGLGLHFFFDDLLGARVVPGQWFDLMRSIGI